MKRHSARLLTALTTTAAVIAPLAVVANAAVVVPDAPRTGALVQVGPIADHGFPTWYRDTNGIRLEGCTTLDDPLCSTLPDEVPNPDQPISYPNNFPGEFFYQLASASVAAGTAGTVDVGMDLEGAWATEVVREGDQMVFGRIRIRASTAPSGEYRITHPYGVDEFTATGGTGINMTEDIGTTPGAFGGALNSRVGPFLTWDTFTPGDTTPGGPGEPPAGYVGVPGELHAVKGSPYDTNFVKVERKAADGSWQVIGQTNLFDVQGRLAVNDGVDVQQATYSTAADGTKVVEVFATSEAGAAIKMIAPDLGYKAITLEEDSYEASTGPTTSHQEGRYYGRFAVKAGTTVTGGADATKIVIQNSGDVPVASKTVSLSDVVTVSKAAYDGSALTVDATSSDPAAALTVVGYGALTDGTAAFAGVDAPPHVVTVRSSEGGTATVPIQTSGPFTQPDPPVAVATVTPTRPLANQTVTLDASGSLDATSYEWTAPAGVTPTSPLDAQKLTFTAPPGQYEFSLVAIGETGRSEKLTIPVRVTVADVVTARAGAAQTVLRGSKVTLNGALSIGAESYRWEQIPNVEGQDFTPVDLSDATALQPTFTLPQMDLPIAPGPNSTYSAVAATPLRFRLTVTGNGMTDTAETVVRPQAETLAVTEARYRTRGEWRVSGTSDLKAGQRVAIVLGSRLNAAGLPTLGSARGQVLGYATVDTLGAWTYRGAGLDPRPSGATTLTVVSTMGGQVVQNITVTS